MNSTEPPHPANLGLQQSQCQETTPESDCSDVDKMKLKADNHNEETSECTTSSVEPMLIDDVNHVMHVTNIVVTNSDDVREDTKLNDIYNINGCGKREDKQVPVLDGVDSHKCDNTEKIQMLNVNDSTNDNDAVLTIMSYLIDAVSNNCTDNDVCKKTSFANSDYRENCNLSLDEPQVLTKVEFDEDTSSDSDMNSDDTHDSVKINKCDDVILIDREEEDEPLEIGKAREKIRVKGEVFPEELPPIENLRITVDDRVELVEFGEVSGIVDALVVIKSIQGLPALNEDSVLFTEHRISLGSVFEIFGPVVEPSYIVRFNDVSTISQHGITIGMKVFSAPSEQEYSKFVFVSELKKMRGSDASWIGNVEPPDECVEYSDDEQEKLAKSKRRQEKGLPAVGNKRKSGAGKKRNVPKTNQNGYESFPPDCQHYPNRPRGGDNAHGNGINGVERRGSSGDAPKQSPSWPPSMNGQQFHNSCIRNDSQSGPRWNHPQSGISWNQQFRPPMNHSPPGRPMNHPPPGPPMNLPPPGPPMNHHPPPGPQSNMHPLGPPMNPHPSIFHPMCDRPFQGPVISPRSFDRCNNAQMRPQTFPHARYPPDMNSRPPRPVFTDQRFINNPAYGFSPAVFGKNPRFN